MTDSDDIDRRITDAAAAVLDIDQRAPHSLHLTRPNPYLKLSRVLVDVIRDVRYENWEFHIRDLTLSTVCSLEITTTVPNSDNKSQTIRVTHIFGVQADPKMVLGRDYWERWVLDCIFNVYRHEAMENFWIGDERPFYPEHGPGAASYAVKRKIYPKKLELPHFYGGPAVHKLRPGNPATRTMCDLSLDDNVESATTDITAVTCADCILESR